MEENMKEDGKMENSMGKQNITTPQISVKLEFGRMAKD